MYELVLAGGILLWIVAAFLYMRSGLVSAFHPASFYMLFHGFIFVLRPIFAYFSDFNFVYDVYQFMPTMQDKITALLVADFGFVCFMTAVLWFGRQPLVLAATAYLRNDDQRSHRWHLIIASVLIGPLGVYGLFYVLRGMGNTELVGMVRDAATGNMINSTSNGYLFTAGDIAGALAVLIAWQFRFRLVALLPFAFFFAMRATSGMRWTFVLAGAAICLFWMYDQRRKVPTARVVVGGLLVVSLFTLLGEQRDAVQRWVKGETAISNQIFQNKFLEGMDYANMEYLEFVVRAVPDYTGTYGYFVDNLQVLTEPVPRVLWPQKPVGAPIKMWDFNRYGNPVGMTTSMPGEGWSQLGYAGVAIWCGLWGMLFGKFYDWFVRSRQSDYQVAIYLLLLPLSVQVFRDGVLLSALKFPMWFLFTVLVWRATIWAIGEMRPNSANANRYQVLRQQFAPADTTGNGMGISSSKDVI